MIVNTPFDETVNLFHVHRVIIIGGDGGGVGWGGGGQDNIFYSASTEVRNTKRSFPVLVSELLLHFTSVVHFRLHLLFLKAIQPHEAVLSNFMAVLIVQRIFYARIRPELEVFCFCF